MSFGTKLLLAIVGMVAFIVIGAAGAGYYWWTHHKDELLGKAKAVIEEGRTAGRATDNQGCVDQALSRHKADRSFTGSVSHGLFLRSCLDSSRLTPNFCDSVPKSTEFMKLAQWQAARCKEAGLSSDQFCQQLFQSVEQYCHQRER